MQLSRARYAALYGPTTGDKIRLADTDLLIEVTDDLCGGPGRAGDEAVFGGGKVLRESMGQGRVTRADGAPDVVITGAVVLDHWGIIKADVGIRDGRIVALGKAGNPDTMDGVHPALVVGPTTEVIAGNGPCNKQRLNARVKAWEDGAWFRDGLLAHAEKAAARRAAAKIAAE